MDLCVSTTQKQAQCTCLEPYHLEVLERQKVATSESGRSQNWIKNVGGHRNKGQAWPGTVVNWVDGQTALIRTHPQWGPRQRGSRGESVLWHAHWLLRRQVCGGPSEVTAPFPWAGICSKFSGLVSWEDPHARILLWTQVTSIHLYRASLILLEMSYLSVRASWVVLDTCSSRCFWI